MPFDYKFHQRNWISNDLYKPVSRVTLLKQPRSTCKQDDRFCHSIYLSFEWYRSLSQVESSHYRNIIIYTRSSFGDDAPSVITSTKKWPPSRPPSLILNLMLHFLPSLNNHLHELRPKLLCFATQRTRLVSESSRANQIIVVASCDFENFFTRWDLGLLLICTDSKSGFASQFVIIQSSRCEWLYTHPWFYSIDCNRGSLGHVTLLLHNEATFHPWASEAQQLIQ